MIATQQFPTGVTGKSGFKPPPTPAQFTVHHSGYGTGANGKSVLTDTTVGILGDYHVTAPITTFVQSQASDQHQTDLAGLRGARLVTAIETEEGRKWTESKLKSITGGDRVAARFMRQDFFEFSPASKLFIAGNHNNPFLKRQIYILLLSRVDTWHFGGHVGNHADGHAGDAASGASEDEAVRASDQ
jgi:hypothetical protein